jgi:hypothetical protein
VKARHVNACNKFNDVQSTQFMFKEICICEYCDWSRLQRDSFHYWNWQVYVRHQICAGWRGGGWSEYQKPLKELEAAVASLIANGDEQKETQSRLVAPPPATTIVCRVEFNADRAAADELAQLKTKLSSSSAANTVTRGHSQSAAGAVSQRLMFRLHMLQGPELRLGGMWVTIFYLLHQCRPRTQKDSTMTWS